MNWTQIKEDQERLILRPYASFSNESRGRDREELPCNIRTIYERDANRIQYSSQFRRLRHKTQVFFNTKNDHVCTRLEHVLNVSAISETISKTLGLNTELTRAIALGHDLGHAPFGHTGERVINKCLKECKNPFKFRHEEQSLRVVERLGQHVDKDGVRHHGLNLTYEVRDGIVCHCGELKNEYILYRDTTKSRDSLKDPNIAAQRPYTLEGCLVRLVDKIAYVGRDIEDAIRVGLISDEADSHCRKVLGKNNGEIINTLVMDVIENSYGEDIIRLSDEKGQALKELIEQNYERIYKADKIKRYEKTTENMLEGLFESLYEAVTTMSIDEMEASELDLHRQFGTFIRQHSYNETETDEHKVADFLSGMTDGYAIKAFESIYLL
ncbi:MAG: dNTP triphosphohydrolase [Clostridia bacterium]|nr:dNTP triphosphohydrolase [Clostridia bacterium]